MNDKYILDACCGGRMFWFNKNHPNAIYNDIREEEKGHNPRRKNHCVKPDTLYDFKKLGFDDNVFKLVIFDPPHLFLGKTSLVAKIYGRLEKHNWKDELKKGFDECMRVLCDYGILIFKWNEFDIPKSEIVKLFEIEPLVGHCTNRSTTNTHWLCYMKIP